MEISKFNKQIISSLAGTFARISNAKSYLLLSNNELNCFSEFANNYTDFIINVSKGIDSPSVANFDIVLGDLTSSGNSVNSHSSVAGLEANSLDALIKSITLLSKEGYGMFAIDPVCFNKLNQSNDIRFFLKEKGYAVSAVFNTPKHFIPKRVYRPLIIVIKRGSLNEEFIGELENPEQAVLLADGYFAKKEGRNLSDGIWLSPASFNGFYDWKSKQKTNSLDTKYKTFESRKIFDIAIAINTCKVGDCHANLANSIYIPKYQYKTVTCDFNQISLAHHKYFQVVCNHELALAEYLVAFFDSKLGKLSIQSHFVTSNLRIIKKSTIPNIEIALPTVLVQKEITNTINKFNIIRDGIKFIEENLALNPISEDTVEQIESILDAVGKLTESDQIKSIIRSGESKKIEFKQTFSIDIRNNNREGYIQDVVIKTIAAFLNSEGGTLLVGVKDDGHIVGISEEISKFHTDNDTFLLHLKNLIKSRIGEQFYTFIDQKLVNIDGKEVLKVECKPSKVEVYVNNKDFYVRTNPATDKLEGPTLVAYIENHFRR